jgi:sulfoxide reductase heme-binding subunit YedZ
MKTRLFYWLVFLICLSPAVKLSADVYTGENLGPNPVETLLHTTGRTALALLLGALTVTPIRRLTGWNRVQSVRRMVGVWSFFYALCHFLIYVVFNHLGIISEILDDIFKRKFIFSGMLAFTILLVLAATSTNGMIRRLGRRWQRLHRLAYVAAIAAATHFVWGQKADIREPLVWAAYLAILLGLRVVWSFQRRAASSAQPASSHASRRNSLKNSRI